MNNVSNISVERWGWASIGVNILLSLLNLGISVASGSLAVAAEMTHNLVDLVASASILIGLKISQRKSKAFPYGLYKVENVVAVGVSGMIFFTAYEIVREALLAPPRTAIVNPWMLAGVILSTVIPMTFSYFEIRAGRAANSPSLIADAQEYRAHIFSSGAVFVALLGQSIGLHLDRWAAIFVAFFIAKTGWELLQDGMRVLLDASLDAPTMNQVRQIIQSDPATIRVKTLIGRNSGRYRFIETEVELRVNELQKAHAVSRRLEQAIREKVPHVERVLIHYEPFTPSVILYAVPLSTADGKLSEHFGQAPFFAFATLRLADKVVEILEIIPNPYTEELKAKGIRVTEWLVSKKVDRVFVKESLKGKGPEYALANAGIEIIDCDADTLDAALELQVKQLAEKG